MGNVQHIREGLGAIAVARSEHLEGSEPLSAFADGCLPLCSPQSRGSSQCRTLRLGAKARSAPSVSQPQSAFTSVQFRAQSDPRGCERVAPREPVRLVLV